MTWTTDDGIDWEDAEYNDFDDVTNEELNDKGEELYHELAPTPKDRKLLDLLLNIRIKKYERC